MAHLPFRVAHRVAPDRISLGDVVLDSNLDSVQGQEPGDPAGEGAGTLVESALGPTAARERRDLSEDACHALLAEVGWGVLSTVELVDQGAAGVVPRPYAVPVAYAFDGVALYVATGPGRKLRALERNPRLTLTVTDVQGLSRWRSVVVTGSAVWLTQPASRASAICAFVAQKRADGHKLTPRDVRRLVAARVLRIQVTEISGCGCDPEPEAAAAVAAAPPAPPGPPMLHVVAPRRAPGRSRRTPNVPR